MKTQKHQNPKWIKKMEEMLNKKKEKPLQVSQEKLNEKGTQIFKLRVPEESLILNFLKNIESAKSPDGTIDFKKARARLAYLYSIKKEKIAEQIIFLQDLGFLKINAGNIKLNYRVLNGNRI